ncbi:MULTISPECIES: hypothetical protein [unclassified Streptomyces]|uniref:hypothetical protein n=1 Tax=unclassified Streptomyces TaxID=2593676 RepID=UPI0029BF846F|nr:hypothetical protein [Streptomyces sp. FL07-04A]MDX3575386.1 hypothetical protein [Streptomyces sp. FL07-04A]
METTPCVDWSRTWTVAAVGVPWQPSALSFPEIPSTGQWGHETTTPLTPDAAPGVADRPGCWLPGL